MATREQIIAKNKRSRTFREKMKKLLAVMKVLLLSAFGLLIVGALIVYGVNNYKSKAEAELLKEAGLYNTVTVDGEEINITLHGKEDGRHTVVAIADTGANNFSVYAKHMLSHIEADNRIALIDRAGVGMSSDSNKPQTTQQIVETYRKALKAAKVDGPYVLLAHNFGGVYATYWSLEYPDEVESIIFVEGTIIDEKTSIKSTPISNKDKVMSFLCEFGLQRVSGNPKYVYSSPAVSQRETTLIRALNMRNSLTKAHLSERSLLEENLKTVIGKMKETNIPKLYISATNGFRDTKDVLKYWEYKNAEMKVLDKPLFYDFLKPKSDIDKDVADFIDSASKKYYAETVAFCRTLGNCQVTRVPGDIKIHEQKPDGVAEALKDFMKYLNGELEEMAPIYDDSRVVEWEKYQESQKSTT